MWHTAGTWYFTYRMLWHSWLSYFVCVFNTIGCSLSDPRFYNASVFFLKHGEHTWGLSSVFDSHHWSNDAFYPVMSNLSKLDHYINVHVPWPDKTTSIYNVHFIYLHVYLQIGYGFVNGTLSWQEQRNFTNLGLEALGNHTLATEIVHQLGLIQAKKPNMSGENQIRQVYTRHV